MRSHHDHRNVSHERQCKRRRKSTGPSGPEVGSHCRIVHKYCRIVRDGPPKQARWTPVVTIAQNRSRVRLHCRTVHNYPLLLLKPARAPPPCHRSAPPCGRGIVRPLIPRGDTHFAQEARGAPRLPPCWWRRGGAKSPGGPLWESAVKTASTPYSQEHDYSSASPAVTLAPTPCAGPSLGPNFGSKGATQYLRAVVLK